MYSTLLYKMEVFKVTYEARGFRLVKRPEGVPASSRYALVVVDGKGMPHVPLTEFHQQLQGELTDGAARSYLNALLPYFTYLDAD